MSELVKNRYQKFVDSQVVPCSRGGTSKESLRQAYMVWLVGRNEYPPENTTIRGMDSGLKRALKRSRQTDWVWCPAKERYLGIGLSRE